MKILVIGQSGQLAQELQFISSDFDNLELLALGRPSLNLLVKDSAKKSIERFMPHFIVNASAYTAVDKAETDSAAAYQINVEAVATIAKIANKMAIPLIHISTDYIFEGNASVPYSVEAAYKPQSTYGRTKLAGELVIQSLCPKHIIIRTAWLYSNFGNNFVKTMLRLGAERDELGIVADQIGSPTNARDLATVILRICQKLFAPHKQDVSALYGTFHYTNTGQCTWYDFAKEIFRHAKEKGIKQPKRLKKITTEQFPTPAKRPSYSVMGLIKIKEIYDIEIPTWQNSLKMMLDSSID